MHSKAVAFPLSDATARSVALGVGERGAVRLIGFSIIFPHNSPWPRVGKITVDLQGEEGL